MYLERDRDLDLNIFGRAIRQTKAFVKAQPIDGRVRVRVRKRQAAVYAESGWSEKTLKRPYLETMMCFELLNST